MNIMARDLVSEFNGRWYTYAQPAIADGYSCHFGAAWEDGTLRVYVNHLEFEVYRCRSYRQAVRQLRRWLRGQGVTAVRVS